MEQLEKMFPRGFVLIYDLEKQVRYHIHGIESEITPDDVRKCADILEQRMGG